MIGGRGLSTVQRQAVNKITGLQATAGEIDISTNKNFGKIWSPKPLKCENYSSLITTQVYQTRHWVPFGGKLVKARMKFYNDSTVNTMVIGVGFAGLASGRDFNELNPLKADGTANSYQLQSTDISIAPCAIADNPTIAYSDWFDLYVEPDISDPTYGTIYTRVQSSANGRSNGFASTNALLAPPAWRTTFQNQKSYSERYPLATFTTAFPTSGYFADINERPAWLEIKDVSPKYTIACFGDSTMDGSGFNGEITRNHYRNKITEAHPNIAWMHYAFAGQTASQFLTRAISLLSQDDFNPDAVLCMVASSNDTSKFTEATIVANNSLLAQVKELCDQRGIKLITVATHAYMVNNATLFKWWDIAMTNAKSNNYCFDMSGEDFNDWSGIYPVVYPTLVGDGVHFNDAGHTLAANKFSEYLMNILKN